MCIIPSLDQNYFENYQDLFKIFSTNQFLACCGRPGGRPALFQVRSVDRPVDRDSDRWVRACVHVSRSTGRSTGPHFGRPTFGRLKDINSLFVSVDRAVDRELVTAKFFENPVNRPVDRGWISALTDTLFNMFLNVCFVSKRV